jgi:hypothetical protein
MAPEDGTRDGRGCAYNKARPPTEEGPSFAGLFACALTLTRSRGRCSLTVPCSMLCPLTVPCSMRGRPDCVLPARAALRYARAAAVGVGRHACVRGDRRPASHQHGPAALCVHNPAAALCNPRSSSVHARSAPNSTRYAAALARPAATQAASLLRAYGNQTSMATWRTAPFVATTRSC